MTDDDNDPASLERQLKAIWASLKSEASELEHVLRLANAKRIYEKLYPETRHGGDRSQDAKLASCSREKTPSFVRKVWIETGIPTRTVSRWVAIGEELSALGDDVLSSCDGTRVANDLPFLRRLARLPKQLHARLIEIYVRGAGPREAKKRLTAAEDFHGVATPKKETNDPEPTTTDDEVEAATSIVKDYVNALGVESPDEGVSVIRALQAEIAKLKAENERLRARNRTLREQVEKWRPPMRSKTTGKEFWPHRP